MNVSSSSRCPNTDASAPILLGSLRNYGFLAKSDDTCVSLFGIGTWEVGAREGMLLYDQILARFDRDRRPLMDR